MAGGEKIRELRERVKKEIKREEGEREEGFMSVMPFYMHPYCDANLPPLNH